MRRIKLSSVACLDLPYLSNYIINGTIFREKGIEREMHVLILSSALVLSIFDSKKKCSPTLLYKFIVLRVNYPYYCQILIKFDFSMNP